MNDSSILPRISTEDFLAIDNIKSVLSFIDWNKKVSVRDTKRLDNKDRLKNLVVICSPKSNSFTNEIQEILIKKDAKFYQFALSNDNKWQIICDNGSWTSRSFDQISDYTSAGKKKHEICEQKIDDIATITKITNPWNYKNKIIIVAGIRGIGTWATAEYIKKIGKNYMTHYLLTIEKLISLP